MLIVVTGPPRSGVEFIRQILMAGGIGTTGADASDAVSALHDWLFETLGGSWWDVPHLDPAWLPQAIVDAFQDRARRLIAQHREHTAWVIADTRMALLLSLWKPLLPTWCAILAARDALATAAALQHEPQASFPLPHGLALWEHYTAAALSNLGGCRVLVVDPDAFTDAPAASLRRLHDALAEAGTNMAAIPDGPSPPPLFRTAAAAGALSVRQAELEDILRAAKSEPGWSTVPATPLPDWQPPALIDLNRQHRLVLDPPPTGVPEPRPTTSRQRRLRIPRQWVAGMEHLLCRAYYGIPLLPYPHKRRGVLWLHRHLSWLTRHTESFQHFKRQAGDGAAPQADDTTATDRSEDTDAGPVSTASQVSISLVMPVFNAEPAWLRAAIDSVMQQSYPHWELCIADDGSTRADTRAVLAALDHPRIRLTLLPVNQGIAPTTNAALALASGTFVGFMDHDDLLTPDALQCMAEAIDRHDPDILYSDEDKVDTNGRLHDPHLKPAYSPDLLLAQNYMSHFTVCRRSLIDAVGGLRTGYDGAQDHDLLLRLVERTERVHHIPKVLYHWRQIPGSTSLGLDQKSGAWAAGLRAVGDAVARRGIAGDVQYGPYGGTYRVRRRVSGTPRVSIIVPFRDQPALLSQCLDSILEATAYQHWELIAVDNHSSDPAIAALRNAYSARDARIRFIDYAVPFNYAQINNHAAGLARGEHLLLLNNDISIIDDDWLEILLAHSQRPEVGAVGCKLLYPDDSLQHAGIIIGLGGVAGHSHKHLPNTTGGYFSRPHLTHDISAVTAACLMVKSALYRACGGLDERRLRVAFNDVDFCLRLREAGYLNIYAADCVLYHHESKSRGYEDNPAKIARFAQEIAFMQRRHQAILAAGDPYYHPDLTLHGDSFSLKQAYARTVEGSH